MGKRSFKILLKFTLLLLLLFVFLLLFFSIPAVQSSLGKRITNNINTKYNTNISIEKVGLLYNGNIKLKSVFVKDHYQDTLFFVKGLNSSILSFAKIYDNNFDLGAVNIDGLAFHLKTYKNDHQSNMDIFLNKFTKNNPSSTKRKFLLQSSNLLLRDSEFKLENENNLNPLILNFKALNVDADRFRIDGPTVSAAVEALSFADPRGAKVHKLSTNFSYSPTAMNFKNLVIKTANSSMQGQLSLDYNKGDLQFFKEKVRLSASFVESQLFLEDLNIFLDEFGANQLIYLNTSIQGTLNDLSLTDLEIESKNNTYVKAQMHLHKLFGTPNLDFKISINFDALQSTYNNLVAFMPRLLGKSIPSNFNNIGQFNIKGNAEITPDYIQSQLCLDTAFGSLSTDIELLQISDIDNASYDGMLNFKNFDLAQFFSAKRLGPLTANLKVKGAGLTLENLNTSVNGGLNKFTFNNYEYSNTRVSGLVQDRIFNGAIEAKDENLNLSFDGLIDYSGDTYNFDFKTDVKYANLQKLNFIARDSLSKFSGYVGAQLKGTNVDNVYGFISFKNTTYSNENNAYSFSDFKIKSEFTPKNERVISVNSPEIITGTVKGKFKIKEIALLLENSFSYRYRNIRLHKVSPDQDLVFKFNIHNKIAAIFLPKLSLAPDSYISGRLNSNPKFFKSKVKSPSILYDSYYFEGLNFIADNNNPIFANYIEIDSLDANKYQLSDFSLINTSIKDSLFVKANFKGGKQNQDYYDLNLYYTTGLDGESVLGINKSLVHFKDKDWFLNALGKDKQNKLSYNFKTKVFHANQLSLKHQTQTMLLDATLDSGKENEINIQFKNVDLSNITPKIDSLALNGNVNGYLSIRKQQSHFVPTSDISINDFTVNAFPLGNFNAFIQGEDSPTKYRVAIDLQEDSKEALSIQGTLDVSKEDSFLDLAVNFNDFTLEPITPLGGGVITNIRGLLSGPAQIKGRLQRPDITGLLRLDGGGLSVPYLNVDYQFGANTAVRLQKQSFLFDQALLEDSKYKSMATLSGALSHVNLSKWSANLELNANDFLVLDTKQSDQSSYYGTTFVNGNTTLTGPLDKLFIQANVATAKNTFFKIPFSDNKIIEESTYIRFLSPEEKIAKSQQGSGIVLDDFKGLEMEFNLDLNENAEIELIIDRNSGSTISGRGNGSLLAQINTKGKFQMFGDFIASRGVYSFVYGKIIQKKFQLVKDGTVAWDGDPMGAQINLKAIYDGINVNPSTLLDNPINQSIPVEVEIHLTNQLEKPDLNFDIRFPSVNSTLNTELNDRLRDRDKREFQAISLLATGAFRSDLTLDSQDALGLVSDGLTNMLNELFSDEDNKLKLGLDVDIGKNTPDYETDSRVGVTLSTQISDDILINGKVGVPVGGVSQTTVAGDFEVEVLLNEDRTLSLKFFNRENSIQNFGEQIGYSQGLGLSYNLEFENLKQLLAALFSKKKKVKSAPIQNENQNQSPNYIYFKNN